MRTPSGQNDGHNRKAGSFPSEHGGGDSPHYRIDSATNHKPWSIARTSGENSSKTLAGNCHRPLKNFSVRNTDLVPAALLARFGRATAEQVVDQIEERMAAPRQRGFRARFAGRELQPGSERDFALSFLSSFTPMGTGPAGAALMGGVAMGGTFPMATASHGAGPLGAGMPGMAA